MADPNERMSDVAAVSEQFGGMAAQTAAAQRARRVEALSLHLAGLSWEQIADRMSISVRAAYELVQRMLETAERMGVDQLREVENQRLDRAQAAIWTEVLKGDVKAINTFLRISDHRAKLNGVYAPTKIDLAMTVRQELTVALNQLDEIVLPMLEADVIEDAVLEEEVPLDESAVGDLFRDPADQP